MEEKDIKYNQKIGELRLVLGDPDSRSDVFIFLEGKTDVRLFRKLFNLDVCKVEIIPGGKLNVEQCVSELLLVHDLTIGIRDADFLHLSGEKYEQPNVFLTDWHDMEMSLVAENECFSAVLWEFTEMPVEEHERVRANILQMIKPMSLLKWLNERGNLELKFDDTGFSNLLNFDAMRIDFEQYFNRVKSKSKHAKITNIQRIIAETDTLKAQNPNALQLCNGHDFMKAFAEFLRIKGNQIVRNEIVASIFRATYSKEHFKRTRLYADTKQWADEKQQNIYD